MICAKNLTAANCPLPAGFFSARQLAVLYNCSHQTANGALNLLAGEGAITRKHGSGSYRKQEITRPKIACLLDDSNVSDFSTLSYLVKFLLLLLEKNQCDCQLFSFQDLKSANFSPHIFRGFDGLITDTRYNDPNSMQLIYDFDRPKLWPWPTFYQLATGNQVVADYLQRVPGKILAAFLNTTPRIKVHAPNCLATAYKSEDNSYYLHLVNTANILQKPPAMISHAFNFKNFEENAPGNADSFTVKLKLSGNENVKQIQGFSPEFENCKILAYKQTGNMVQITVPAGCFAGYLHIKATV